METDGESKRPEPRPAVWNAADRARLRKMLDDHYDTVYRALQRFGVPAGDVEDAAQKTFMVASAKLDLIAPGCERAFLLATAANKAAHARRTLARRREISDEDDTIAEEVVDPGLLPDELVEQERRRTLFYKILAGMDSELQTVFVLFELEGMLTKDIATALDVPTGTVASRLRRAREEFTRLATRTMRQTAGAV